MKGLQYYQAETSRFRDIKVRKLMKKKGIEGYGIYAFLLNECYNNGYFITWDDDTCYLASDDIYTDEETIKDVVEYCVEVGLFDKQMYEQNKVLTSKSIQSRYEEICKSLRRKVEITAFWLLKNDNNVVDSEINDNNVSNNTIIEHKEQECSLSEDKQQQCSLSTDKEQECSLSEQNKIKEKKENKIKENITNNITNNDACENDKNAETDAVIMGYVAELENDPSWLNDISNDPLCGIKPGAQNDVKVLLIQFAREKISDKIDAPPLREFIQHFKRWLRLNKRIQDTNKKNTQNDKRRGTDCGNTRAEEFKTSF